MAVKEIAVKEMNNHQVTVSLTSVLEFRLVYSHDKNHS